MRKVNPIRRPAPQQSRLLLFNKPYGVLTQFSGETADITLKHYIDVADVYPAGRLDKDSEGLLVLTNNGNWQHRISDPKHKMAKTYWVQVEGIPSAQTLAQLTQGVRLNDGMTLPAKVELLPQAPAVWPRNPPIRVRQSIPDSWLALTIHEGKNRQVRRMTAAVGHPTLRLIRAQIGPWDLTDLGPGEWREVAPLW
ncbi:MAG: Ribosomal large subunit pseudouridine synthase E [Pseudidiomarina mangrovi]|nr:MAG: Ribosomal large subunit pseudouridine synthase E [Pseudidiomarina mangrovi]